MTLSEITDAASIIHDVAHPDANIIFGSVIDESIGEAVRVTVIAAGFDAVQPAKSVTTSSPVDSLVESPRASIFAETTDDNFAGLGDDDDLPSFLR